MKRTKHFYSLLNNAGDSVQIDLNNYNVICNDTGERKRFYHKYLAGLIKRKYDNNIDLFRTSYRSRQPVDQATKQARKIQARIDRLTTQLNQAREDQLAIQATATPVE
jgi:outer membrane murein-binding lipoprotein Lpp